LYTDYLDPVAAFDVAVPEQFLEDTLRCLFGCYRVAAEECRMYPVPEQRYLRPHMRRALFEWQWRAIAEGFPGMQCSVVPNNRESADHTEVVSGNVVITASAVEHRYKIARPAGFRETLARSNVRWLFPDLQILPPPDALLCSLLIHGPADPRTPAFADIVFPTPDNKGYAGNRICLFDRFPWVVESLTTFREEVVEPPAEPRLRDDVAESEGDDTQETGGDDQ
jgi:hypothetical protein